MLPSLRQWFPKRSAKPVGREHALQLDLLEDRAVPATFIVDSNVAGVGTTLQQAVASANGTAGADTIQLAAVIFGGNPTVNARLNLTESVTIDGTGHSITAGGATGIFGVAGGGSYTFQNVTLQNANDTLGNGGAIQVSGAATVLVSQATFSNDQALRGGAIAVANAAARLTVTNSTFANNRATTGEGGAILLNNTVGAPAQIGGSAFTGNTANTNGGAIGGTAGLRTANSTFSGNNATEGGAIRLAGGAVDLAIVNGTFTGNNAASGDGGAVALRSSGNLVVSNSVFQNNNSGGNGGAISALDPTGTSASPGTLATTISRTFIQNNVAATGGGGLSLGGTTNVVAGNFVTVGGGATALLTDVEVTRNSVTGLISRNQGAGIRTGAKQTRLERVTVGDNSAQGRTGGVFETDPGAAFGQANSLDIVNSTIDRNFTGLLSFGFPAGGSAVGADGDSTSVIRNSTISRNDGGNQTIEGLAAIFSSVIADGTISATGFVGAGVTSLGRNAFDPIYAPFGLPPLLGTDQVANAQLGERQANGGFTTTRLPLLTSPIIDKGSTTLPALPPGFAADTIAPPPDLTVDQRGNPFPRVIGLADVGATESSKPVISVPSALLISAPNVNDASPRGVYDFVVRYSDSNLIRAASIGVGNTVVVQNSLGYSAPGTVVSKSSNVDATVIAVVYRVTPPGGSWTVSDNGIYTINVVQNAVVNIQGSGNPASSLGTFTVAVTTDVPSTGGGGGGGGTTVTPSAEVGAIAPACTATGYVKALYCSILGRNADATGLAGYVSRLNAGESRASIADAIWMSDEHRKLQIQETFQRFLSRSATAADVDAYTYAIGQGMSEESFYAQVASSAESRALRSTPAAYVEGLYDFILGRFGDAAAIPYVNAVTADPNTALPVAHAILNSDEYANTLLSAYYLNFLGRPLDAPAGTAWASVLKSGLGQRQVAIALLSSPEFFSKAGDFA